MASSFYRRRLAGANMEMERIIGKKRVTLVFRYDDFSSDSPDEVEEKLIDAFAQNQMPCTLGVIPFVTTGSFRDPTPCESQPLSEAKVKMLKRGIKNGAVDISLHGCYHRTTRPQSPHTEFAGLPEEAQIEKISMGKDFLEDLLGIPVTVFIPPWNSYDVNTVVALEKTGILCLSANRAGMVSQGRSLKYLPITIELPDVRRAVDEARRSDDPAPIVAVLMHPYDFKESGDSRGKIDATDLQGELSWLSRQDDVDVLSISELANQSADLGPDRFWANAPFSFECVAPPFVQATTERTFYLSLKSARVLRRLNQGSILLFYAVSALIFALAGYGASKLLIGFSERLPYLLSNLIIIVLIAYATHALLKRRVFFRGLLFCVANLGFFIGNWIAIY